MTARPWMAAVIVAALTVPPATAVALPFLGGASDSARSPDLEDLSPPQRVRALERMLHEARHDAARTREEQARRRRERRIEVLRTVTILMPNDAPSDAGGDPSRLREELARERRRRRTLEAELSRVTGHLDASEPLADMARTLEAARAEILVLQRDLVRERSRREDLETSIERAREAADAASPGEPVQGWVRRLVEVVQEQQAEIDALTERLSAAQEKIVRLRGHLETVTPDNARDLVRKLDEENETLRTQLSRARHVNRRLRARAALAGQLADMIYER